jgi:hypothetical protein
MRYKLYFKIFIIIIILKELNEEHTRILTARNPQAAENIIRFSYKVKKKN